MLPETKRTRLATGVPIPVQVAKFRSNRRSTAKEERTTGLATGQSKGFNPVAFTRCGLAHGHLLVGA
jgi:hypothetical protein